MIFLSVNSTAVHSEGPLFKVGSKNLFCRGGILCALWDGLAKSLANIWPFPFRNTNGDELT
jgi:hypothetical protein